MDTYKTKEIARLAGVHPNTVRLYEEAGFITPPKRLKNGYRIFTELHLRQLALVRLVLRAEVLQNGLRKKAVEIILLCAERDFDRAIQSAREYEAMLIRETDNAKNAVAAVEAVLKGKHKPEKISLTRREAAGRLSVTVDTLRNWELNGLITVRRSKNGYRVYDASDIERLNIIRTLRCANYSLSAILRLLNHLDDNRRGSVAEILNTPEAHEDIVSACDRLILSLENTRKDAEEIFSQLAAMQLKFVTLQ